MKWTIWKWTVGLSVAILLAFTAAAQPAGGSEPLTGLWDGTVLYGGYKIPFPIEFSQKGADVTGSFFNGNDRVTSTGGRLARPMC